MQLTVVVGADWTLHPWCHNSRNVGGGTAGQARHNSSNVGVSLQARWYTTLVGTLQVEDRCQRPTDLRRINR